MTIAERISKWKVKLALGVLLGISILLLAVLWKPFLVYSHKRSMERAFDLMVAVPDANGKMVDQATTSESLQILISGRPLYANKRYEYHRDALVDFGCLEHVSYEFQHIRIYTDESRAIWKLVQSTLPFSMHTYMSEGNYIQQENSKAVLIETWVTPGESDIWQRFFQKHDVPDFKDRFMANPSADTPVASN